MCDSVVHFLFCVVHSEDAPAAVLKSVFLGTFAIACEQVGIWEHVMCAICAPVVWYGVCVFDNILDMVYAICAMQLSTLYVSGYVLVVMYDFCASVVWMCLVVVCPIGVCMCLVVVVCVLYHLLCV